MQRRGVGHFEGERVETALPLSKCLGRPKCTVLQDFAYTISNFFPGVTDTP